MLQIVHTSPMDMLRLIFRSPRPGIEEAVVVARNEDLVLEGQGIEPVDLGLDFCDGAVVCEITGVDYDVAWWEEGRFEVVRVRNADETDTCGRFGEAVWRATKKEEKSIDVGKNESKRTGKEGVDGMRWFKRRWASQEGKHLQVKRRDLGC